MIITIGWTLLAVSLVALYAVYSEGGDPPNFT